MTYQLVSKRPLQSLEQLRKALTQRWNIRSDPAAFVRSIGVTIGDNCEFISLKPGTFGTEPYLVRLGNHVRIGGGVQFITHDGGVWIFRQEMPTIDVFDPISVGNNVFIGQNSLILPGANIGNNVVIGAGSIVTRRGVPSDVIAAGVPARVIKSVDEYFNDIQPHIAHVKGTLSVNRRQKIENWISSSTT